MTPRIAFANALIAQRVVQRYVLAADYKEYVERKKREGEKPLDKKEWEARTQGGKSEGEKPEGKLSLKERLKSLSSKAAEFVKSAPAGIKKFIEDPKHRKETLTKAAKAIKETPGKLAKGAVKAAKKEIHEFKEAGQGIATVLKGGKMTPKQKKALKTVALDIAVTVAVTALTSGLGSTLAGAAKATGASFAKSLAKRVALNAVTDGLGNLVSLQEYTHGVEGLAHHLLKSAADEPDTDEVLGLWVEGLVAKKIDTLSDDDLVEALEGIEE